MEKLSLSNTQSWLGWFLRGILILGFLVLLARLFELQVIKGAYFKSLAEGNRIRRIPITAARGRILARGGEVLVGNKLNTVSGESDEVVTEWIRSYHLGSGFAHLGGYLGEANESEVGKINPDCPEKGPIKAGTLVGRTGIEEYYECTLAGVDGERLLEVDSRGRKVRVLGERPPVPGQDILTNIDLGLQETVSKLLGRENGAIVVTDPKGEVLALYSSASFDPNIFVAGDNQKITKSINNPDLPFFNRVIGGTFHPGSVFKPLVALAALEEGEIDEDFVYIDKGFIKIGDFVYNNWFYSQYGGVEGEINLIDAMARSTDTFFYKLGEFLGIERLVYWSEKLGFGIETGIDLPGEVAALVPSPEWKREVKGERWFLGNTYHMAIGQGFLAVTPLEINVLTSVIASSGLLCGPRVVEESRCSDLELKKENIQLVKNSMIEACKPGGTGVPFFDFPEEIKVGCKTGTAEIDEGEETHAWFSVFGPADFPEIVATVLVERGGEGSVVAAPLAREIFDYWFSEDWQ